MCRDPGPWQASHGYVHIGPACRIAIGGEVVVLIQIRGMAARALIVPGLVASSPMETIAWVRDLARVKGKPALPSLVFRSAAPGLPRMAKGVKLRPSAKIERAPVRIVALSVLSDVTQTIPATTTAAFAPKTTLTRSAATAFDCLSPSTPERLLQLRNARGAVFTRTRTEIKLLTMPRAGSEGTRARCAFPPGNR